MMAGTGSSAWRAGPRAGHIGRVTTPGLVVATVGGSGPLFVALVFLHASSALAGFGSLGFAGTYASRAAHLPAGASFDDPEAEELIRYFQRPARFWKAILLVPVLGVLALLTEPGGKGLDQVWAIFALLVWAAASLLAAGAVMPGLRQMQSMLVKADGPAAPGTPGGAVAPDIAATAWRARLARAGTMASRAAAACDVLFFAALALMIWQP